MVVVVCDAHFPMEFHPSSDGDDDGGGAAAMVMMRRKCLGASRAQLVSERDCLLVLDVRERLAGSWAPLGRWSLVHPPTQHLGPCREWFSHKFTNQTPSHDKESEQNSKCALSLVYSGCKVISRLVRERVWQRRMAWLER